MISPAAFDDEPVAPKDDGALSRKPKPFLSPALAANEPNPPVPVARAPKPLLVVVPNEGAGLDPNAGCLDPEPKIGAFFSFSDNVGAAAVSVVGGASEKAPNLALDSPKEVDDDPNAADDAGAAAFVGETKGVDVDVDPRADGLPKTVLPNGAAFTADPKGVDDDVDPRADGLPNAAPPNGAAFIVDPKGVDVFVDTRADGLPNAAPPNGADAGAAEEDPNTGLAVPLPNSDGVDVPDPKESLVLVPPPNAGEDIGADSLCTT